MKKCLLVLCVVLLVFSLTGCFKKKADENLIGVAMPTQSLQR